MKHVSILVPSGNVLLGSIEGPLHVFNEVNEILKTSNRPPIFKAELVGVTKSRLLNEGSITLHPRRTIGQKFKTDLIIIPALKGDWKKIIALNKKTIEWIRKQRSGGAEVASLCIVSFL